MHDPKTHAKALLGVFEGYCKRQPESVANQLGLKCARELVRLIETDSADKTAIDALRADLAELPPDAGSAWVDLQITAQGCFKQR